MKPILLIFFLILVSRVSTQDLQHEIMISTVQDTVSIMTDYLPNYIKNIPWKSDTATWDMNGLKAPFIRRIIAKKPESQELVFSNSNAVSLQYDQGTVENFQLSGGTLFSLGESGKNLFGDGKIYTGYYIPKRPYYTHLLYPSDKQIEYFYKMVYLSLIHILL